MINRKFIESFFLAGSVSDQSKTSEERIILSNVLFLFVPVIIVVSYILDYKEFIKPWSEFNFDQFTRLMFGGASLVCYFINRKGLFVFSRWLYLISWIAFWLVLDPVIQGTEADYYFHFDLSIIGFAIVSQILFSFKKSPVTFSLLLLFSLVCIFYQQSYLLYFDNNRIETEKFLDNDYTYFTSIYYWAIFNIVIGYLLYIYEKSNIHLLSNNLELDQLTTNLEEVVKERTTDLREKQAELIGITERLQKSEDKYRKLFTNSFEGIARLDLTKPLDINLPIEQQVDHFLKHLRIVECNHVFAELYLHKDPSDLIDESLSFIMDHEESVHNLLKEIISNNYHLNGKVLSESIHDSERWFICHVTSQIDDNKLSWMWLNKLDITEKSKQDLERKLLLQNLEEYAFQTSHELRGPLSRLLGLTSLMQNKKAFKEDELPEMLKHINDTSIEIDDVIRMMNQVLTKSTFESKLTKSRSSNGDK
ncbi:MAG: hypothetical protein ABJH98_08185 [Reichenbachiella sp.]|uniref:hypothetical protein n=1 Tax=Reichenbachiella sp. TaxID=2184521 RepID=UPI0032979A39